MKSCRIMPNITRARMSSPCQYCHQEFKSKTHTCPVMKQLGLALGDRKHRGLHPDTPHPSPSISTRASSQFKRTLCSSEFATAAGLHQHMRMQRKHTAVQPTFQPARDQVSDRLQFAHCDTTFLTLKALKHPIDGNHCEAFAQDQAEIPCLWHRPVILAGLSGGTFDHLLGYKNLVRRLGLRCGLCGYFARSSTSLLRHLGGESWGSVERTHQIC